MIKKMSSILILGLLAALWISACGEKKPVVEYKNDRWKITMVEACIRMQTSPNQDMSGSPDIMVPSAVRVTFKCQTNMPISSVIMENSSGQIFLKDSAGERYYFSEGGGGMPGDCDMDYITFNFYAENTQNLTLSFYGVQVPLPDPVLTDVCLYR